MTFNLEQDEPSVDVPTDADLSSAEEALRIRLPPSYREYAKRYGVGVACGLFVICIPVSPVDSPGEFQLVAHAHREQEQLRLAVDAEWIEYEPDGSPDLVQRLVPFGFVQRGDGDRDLMAWDVARPDQRGEYPVYIVAAGNSEIVLAARDLGEFFTRALDPNCEWDVLGELDGDPAPTFQPLA